MARTTAGPPLRGHRPAGAGIVGRPATRRGREGPIGSASGGGGSASTRGGAAPLTREGATSATVLHARGDSTGWEMVRALLEKTRNTERIEVRSFSCSTDLVVQGGRVVGCRFLGDADDAPETTVLARATLLATGGAGQVFAETTNPAVAGRGRHGLCAPERLLDMEFVQFIHAAGRSRGPRFLISDANGAGRLPARTAAGRFTRSWRRATSGPRHRARTARAAAR